MFKHESVAKAEVKGAFRKATQRYDEFYKKLKTGIVKFNSRKNHLRYIEELVQCRGEFMLDHRVCHHHSSWHFQSVMTSVETEFHHLNNIGNICCLVIDGWDSRKMMKGDIKGHRRFLSRLFLHEHFLIRIVQRLGLTGIKNIGKVLFPLFSYILRENLSFRLVGNDVHFVMPGYVLVAEKLPNSYGLVFKTILMREHFSAAQQAQYNSAYQWMINQQSDCVMLNSDTGHLIAIHFDEPGINTTLLNKSFWMRGVLSELAPCA